MSKLVIRTISGHKKRIGLTAIAVAAVMMLYAIPTQQQFATATVLNPGPITDRDLDQEVEDVLARLINLQEEVEDEQTKDVLARLINVLQDVLARLRPPTPPLPGTPEYCYDTSTRGTVCYTNEQACETDRASDPDATSTSCYQRQP